MIRHIIFNCFGTLIDTGNNSIKVVEVSLSETFAQYGIAAGACSWGIRNRKEKQP